jgi:hypothetical protein
MQNGKGRAGVATTLAETVIYKMKIVYCATIRQRGIGNVLALVGI